MPARKSASQPAPRKQTAKKTPPSPGKEARLIALINMAARLSNRAARTRLGASPGQIPLLVCLHQEDGLIQKELVQRTKMEQPTVAEHLDQLAKDGLIIRRRSKEDGRKYQVFLSAKGRAIMPDLIEGLDSGAKVFTKGLQQKDLKSFERAITVIIEQVEAFIRDSERSNRD